MQPTPPKKPSVSTSRVLSTSRYLRQEAVRLREILRLRREKIIETIREIKRIWQRQ